MQNILESLYGEAQNIFSKKNHLDPHVYMYVMGFDNDRSPKSYSIVNFCGNETIFQAQK